MVANTVVANTRRRAIFAATVVALICAASVPNAQAGILYRVDRVVHGTTGGFQHSLFHSAQPLTNGAKLAWFDLAPNPSMMANIYDPSSGLLRFEGDVFSDRGRTDKIGVFSARSDNFFGSDLGDNNWNGDMVGSIDFDIRFFDTSNPFFDYMSSQLGSTDGTFTRSLNFVDRRYGGVEPLFANSLDLDAGLLTLWGADGDVSAGGSFGRSVLGGDIVLALVPAPEPTSIALWALGGAGCLAAMRRRRRRK